MSSLIFGYSLTAFCKIKATMSTRIKPYTLYTRHMSLPVRLFHVSENISRIARTFRSKSVKHWSGIVGSYLYLFSRCIFSRTSLIWADDLPVTACHDYDLIWQNVLGSSSSMINDVSSLNRLTCLAMELMEYLSQANDLSNLTLCFWW